MNVPFRSLTVLHLSKPCVKRRFLLVGGSQCNLSLGRCVSAIAVLRNFDRSGADLQSSPPFPEPVNPGVGLGLTQSEIDSPSQSHCCGEGDRAKNPVKCSHAAANDTVAPRARPIGGSGLYTWTQDGPCFG